MNIKNYFTVILLCTLFGISCSNEKLANTPDKKEQKIAYALDPLNIYRAEKITQALDSANSLQKSESRKLFMNGLDLLVNKGDAAASIEYFREAILYYPDEKSYTYLFQAYLKNNEFALADSVNFALDGRIPYSESSFNSALIGAAQKDTAVCMQYLYSAIDEGFVFKDRIVNEKLFDFLKDNQSYQSLIVTYFGNEEKLTKILFKAYLKLFPDLELPYEMIHDSAQSFNFDRYINYDFSVFVPALKDGRFSRDVSSEYMYVGKFKTTNGIAVIYKSYEVIADTLNPVYTHMMTYDTLGKIISMETVGCFCSPLERKGFVVNKNLDVDVTTYKTKWENDPLQKGYAGNKIISNDAVEAYKLTITKENALQKTESKEAVAASGQ